MDEFERKVRQRLKELGSENKVYLKKNYEHEVFSRHAISDHEIDFLFDMKKILRIYPDDAFLQQRIIAEVSVNKTRNIEIIFQFDPILKGEVLKGKVGIITAY